MSAFAGRFSRDGGAVARPDIERMVAAAGPAAARHVCIEGAIGIAAADRHAWSAADTPFASTPHAIAVFDGRLDNRRELADACRSNIGGAGDGMSDAALVLTAYERFGDEFAARLNGDFAVAVFDAGRERLLLARDVMASHALYYWSSGSTILFASTIKSLLADPRVSPEPDEDGLAALVLDYWRDDRLTCFKGISSVPAGHVIIATRDRVELRQQWAFNPNQTVRFRSFSDYADAFRPLFAQAVERRLRSRGRVAIAVSGGLDSSSIFCQAAALMRGGSAAADVCGVALTFPPGTAADEQRFLDAVERACDIPIAKIGVSAYRFLDDADATVRQLECPGIVPHTQRDIFAAAQRAGCRVLLSGFFGDQMLADRGYLVDLVRAGRWATVRHDVREFAAWMTDADPEFFRHDLWSRLMRELPPRPLMRAAKTTIGAWRARTRYPPWFTARFRRRAARRARAHVPGVRAFKSAHSEQYYRHVTAGHYIHGVRCERAIGEMYGIDVRYPFRDRDLVAFLMAIPGEIVNWKGVPKGLLRRALAGIVPDAVLGRRSKADFTALEEEALRDGQAEFARLLSAGRATAAGFVEANALGALAAAGGARASLPGWRGTDVVGLELWLRNFFGENEAIG